MNDKLIPYVRRYVSVRRHSPETELLIGKACSREGARVYPCAGKAWSACTINGTLWYNTADGYTRVVRLDV